MANTLFLRFEGPFQSWGERARWGERDTAPEPTKSGVVGLLACALGYQDDLRIRNLSQSIRIGVRCDQPGEEVVDYHTVVEGVMSAEGKIKKNATTHKPETVVSNRVYLCDASFLVAVLSTPDWIDRLKVAIQHPTWPIYLGRKCCPPAATIFAGEGTFDDQIQALQSVPLSNNSQTVRMVIEVSPGEGVRRRDEIDSRKLRTFLPRYTRELVINIPGGNGS
jgi:CRISPR system Cascade subunit CasD